jgi:type IV secretion system protein VirD4
MVVEATDLGILPVSAKEVPLIAVNVLERLGYQVRRSSKQLYQILAEEKRAEQYGRDQFRYEWRLVLSWRKAEDGMLVKVTVSEHNGSGQTSDCQKRCDAILCELKEAASRAHEVAQEYEPSTVHGAARWGNEQELKEHGYIIGKPQAVRLLLAKHGQGEYLSLPEQATYKHALVCGSTGVGKSSGFFVPNLIERLATNMLVTEATPGLEQGELYQLTSGWRKQAGHEIYSFNPADMTSTRINPIDKVRWAKPEDTASEAEKLAELIIRNSSKEGARIDPTWDNSEKQLLVSLILNAAASDENYSHIGAIRWMLLSGVNNIRKVMSRSRSDLAQQEFEGWLQNTSENFRFGVASGLLTKLNPWLTDQIITLTAKTDIKPDSFRDKLFTFYLSVPSRRGDMKLIASLIFNYLLDMMLEERKYMKHPLALLLDEFTNFGYIQGIADVMSIIRKANIGLVLGFQDYIQLERVYSAKEAQIILSQPATQVYFRQKFKEAKALSEALGRTTVEEYDVTDTGRVQERVMGKNLMTVDELMNLDKDYVVILTADTWPVKVKKFPPGIYDMATAYEPPERPRHEISDSIRKRGRKDKPVRKEKPKQKQQFKKPPPEKREQRQDRDRGYKPKEEPEKETKPKDRKRDTPDTDDVWLY